jgi:hypothetical protein
MGVGTKSEGNSNADKACQWLFMLAMQGGFMSESATVGLEFWELRARKGAIRREWRKSLGSSCKQKGRQRQCSELEGHDAVIRQAMKEQ